MERIVRSEIEQREKERKKDIATRLKRCGVNFLLFPWKSLTNLELVPLCGIVLDNHFMQCLLLKQF